MRKLNQNIEEVEMSIHQLEDQIKCLQTELRLKKTLRKVMKQTEKESHLRGNWGDRLIKKLTSPFAALYQEANERLSNPEKQEYLYLLRKLESIRGGITLEERDSPRAERACRNVSVLQLRGERLMNKLAKTSELGQQVETLIQDCHEFICSMQSGIRDTEELIASELPDLLVMLKDFVDPGIEKVKEDSKLPQPSKEEIDAFFKLCSGLSNNGGSPSDLQQTPEESETVHSETPVTD